MRHQPMKLYPNQATRDRLVRAFLVVISLVALAIFSWQSLEFTHQGFAMILHDKAPTNGPGVLGLWWTALGVQVLYAVVVTLLGASPQRPLLWLFTALMAAMSMFGSVTSLYHSLVGDEIAAVAEHKANVERARRENRRAKFEASKENQRRDWLDQIDKATRAYVASVNDRFAETHDALIMASRGHRDDAIKDFLTSRDKNNPAAQAHRKRSGRRRKTANQYRLAAEQLQSRWDKFTAAAEEINTVEGMRRFAALRIAAQHVPSGFELSPPVATDISRPLILDKVFHPDRFGHGSDRTSHQSTVQALWTRATNAPDINVVLAAICALIFELATVMCGWVNGLLIAYNPGLARLAKKSRASGPMEQLKAHIVTRFTKEPMHIPAATQESILVGLMMLNTAALEFLIAPVFGHERKLSYSLESLKRYPLALAVLVRLCDARVATMTPNYIVISPTFGANWLGLVAVTLQSPEHREVGPCEEDTADAREAKPLSILDFPNTSTAT